ncbi:MAG: thiamine diphosphokinase [Lachnospiraceae bacterium]|nr:thiamine diphosphokinase [Lachnospiraceae bacterium]
MKRAVIISGGKIQSDFALAFLEKYTWDLVIGADRGLIFCHKNRIMPTHIVGDFDSAGEAEYQYFHENTDIPIRKLNPVKDFTDTDVALRLALEENAEEIYILGGTGTRVDHIAANVRTLFLALQQKVSACLVDENNKIYLTDCPLNIRKEEQFGTYLSLFAVGEPVENLTLEGVYYPLDGYRLTGLDPLCVSNEIVEKECNISFSKGVLLVIESKD